MSLFERNIAAIADRYPRFRSEVAECFDIKPLEIVATKNGDPSARVDGALLHSARDPRREASATVRAGAPETLSACVCLGFGLGYYAEALQQIFPDIPVFIIEPDVPAFLGALSVRQLTGLFADPRISLLLGVKAEDAIQAVAASPPGAIHIVAPKSLTRLSEPYYSAVGSELERLSSRRRINRNTLRRFGSRWIRNLSSNLGVMRIAGGISRFAGSQSGPAFVIAAGPSLDDVLPLLPELARRGVIIAVDTSIKACLSAGVVPDFVVVVDPQYWNLRHLDRCDVSSSILVSESSTYPGVFRNTYRSIEFCSSLFPLGEYLEKRIGAFGKLGAGGSVSTTAWDLARYIGCSPIYVAGLDLGFPRNQTHFRGSTFEERAHMLSRRLSPAEHTAFLALRDAEPYPVPSNSGGSVLTDKRLIIYRWWFESQIRLHPEAVTWSLSESGVAIDGIGYINPAELVQELPVRFDITAPRITGRESRGLEPDGAATQSGKPSAERFGVRETTVELMVRLRSLRALAGRALAIIEELRSSGPDSGLDIGAAFPELEKIDEQIKSSDGKEIVGFVIQDTIEELSSTRSSGISESDALGTSALLYRTIVESCDFHIAQLDRGLHFFGQGFLR